MRRPAAAGVQAPLLCWLCVLAACLAVGCAADDAPPPTNSTVYAAGEVYAFGGTKADEDPNGPSSKTKLPQNPVEVGRVNALRGGRISDVAGGQYFAVALSATGTVFTWGQNQWGQLGRGGAGSVPTPVAGALVGKYIVAVGAGYFHAVAATETGEVYSWGGNEYGQLGRYGAASPGLIRALPFATERVERLSCGLYHTLALTDQKRAYTWGSNHHGQLGRPVGGPYPGNYPSPLPALDGKRVVAVAAGFHFSAVVTESGQVWTWGDNDFGQLGRKGDPEVPGPVYMSQRNVSFVSVAAGRGHVLALTRNGRVFSWGDNSKGQLGRGGQTNIPRVVDALFCNVTRGMNCTRGASQIAANGFHSAALIEGRLYTWGDNAYNQLGRMPGVDGAVPGPVTSPRLFARVAAGLTTTLAVTAQQAL